MKAETISQNAAATAPGLLADLRELTRARLNLMVVLTTAIGFAVAVEGVFPIALFLHTVIGTALVAAGSSALNQVLEKDTDAAMRRTANRPIPSERMSVDSALAIGVGLSVGGLLQLALAVNILTAFLGAITLASYLFIYTPMKRVSSLATVIGAVPGAIPPVMGWAALRGTLSLEAFALFAILFLWQLPHFLAIAWVYRADYERGGLPMLPVVDPEGNATARQMILYCAALLPVSLMPNVLGMNGLPYFVCAVILGAIYLAYCFFFARSRNNRSAIRLMLASVIYLPALLTAMMLDRLIG
ncbi:MAG: heme o synthase [Deltaproteobacteria bacterium]|nr:heme o synthase [Deltaproteobacteria bacterium]